MKILYVTTIGGTLGFFKEFISDLVRQGHIVDVACNDKIRAVNKQIVDLGCKVHSISCTRSPMSLKTLKTIRELKKIISDNQYDLVHCHTPIAALCARLACRKFRKSGLKVVYTAHGFHFYSGAPKKNWLTYYPIEKMCSYWTDALITINREDYEFAKRKFKAKKVVYVPGVGIDVERFAGTEVNAYEKRKEIGFDKEGLLLLSVGELNSNKNQETVIRALAEIKNDKIYYAIAGRGDKREKLLELIAQYNLTERVKLIGFREDVAQLYKAVDILIHPSYREGLPVTVMEAMASGLPVICGRIRGNVDLIDDYGGKFFNPNSIQECKEAIMKIIDSDLISMGKHNAEIAKKYSLKLINEQVLDVYRSL